MGRKNSIQLPSDGDAGTYLFGYHRFGNPRNQPAGRKYFSIGLTLWHPDSPCFDSFRMLSAYWILCLT